LVIATRNFPSRIIDIHNMEVVSKDSERSDNWQLDIVMKVKP